jgi:hypothetical protein
LEKSQTNDRFQGDDSSDSTDSEHRLVIEDESQGSEPATPVTIPEKKLYDVKPPMGVLESIMMQKDVPYVIGGPNPGLVGLPAKEEKVEVKTEEGSSNEPMSLLLCEETIPGSPAPASSKDPLGDVIPKSTGSTGFVQPQNIMSLSSPTPNFKSANVMTALQHQQQQLTASLSTTTNLKQIDMDIDTEITSNIVTANPGNIPNLLSKIKAGSTTSSGNNTNNNSDNSPRDSISQDDQSDSEKVG